MRRITLAALAIVAMVGCQNKSETPLVDEAIEISFSSQITTRASGTEWQSGDAVGIMVTQNNELVADYKYNAKHNVDITNGTTICGFIPDSDEHTLYWPFDSTETIDFYAYYPYQELVSSLDECYPIEVSDQTTPEAIDFMEASTQQTYPQGYSSSSNETVALSFTRRMSKLSFVITAGEGMEMEDLISVTLQGFYTTADYDFVNNEFINLDTQADIVTHQDGDTYSAIVIPTMDTDQVYTPTSHMIVFSTTQGDMEWDITDIDLNAGAHRLYNVTLAREIVVSGGNQINSWDTESGGELEVE